MCKKRKLNSPLKNYTYPSPNKAIPSLNSDTSEKKVIKIANKNSDTGDKSAIDIANKNSDSSDKKKSISLRRSDQVAILKKRQ